MQWSNSLDVVRWFKTNNTNIKDKFTQFDIEDFYASISKDFGDLFCDITNADKNIIFHARKMLLFSKNSEWIKSNNTDGFNVSIGSYDWAGIYDLIGLYLTDLLGKKFPMVKFGIYKDDVLALSPHTNRAARDRLRKDIIHIMNNLGLNITIDSNLSVVNFLGITLNIVKKSYEPYRKPNDKLSYINVGACHPPLVFKNLVKNISETISGLSSSKKGIQ